MVCLGILWNGMQEHLECAIEDIKQYGEILNCFTINLNDAYENFVRDIYAQDEIADWKVDKKIETMFQCSDNRKVSIVIIDIETSKMAYHDKKKRMVFVNLENMKTEIRKKYSQIITPYFFDNVFHVTDDEKEYKNDLLVVNSYCEKGFNLEKVEFNKKNIKVLKKENKSNEIKE